MSGGVNTIPTTNAATMMYGRFCFKSCGVVAPVQHSRMIATGTSKAIPNAINSASTKSR
jgi:hypothetical protein